MQLLDKLVGGVRRIFSTTGSEDKPNPIVSHYDVLEGFYLNSGIYDRLASLAREGTEERSNLVALRSLRNPANIVVEFYAAKIRTGVIEYGEETNADNIATAISSVDKWSNWESEGRVAARQLAWAGDLFVRVSAKGDGGVFKSVYRERIDPRHVTQFEKDERSYFTYLRIDTPKTRTEPGTERHENKEESYTQTEIWDKETVLYSVYERTTDQLGDPVEETVLSAEFVPDEEGGFTGFDFIPVVHFKFRDVGSERGLSSFGHVIGGIKEADRIATSLHEMLFPDEVWTLERGAGPDGLELPALEMEDETSEGALGMSPYMHATGAARDRSIRDKYTTVGKRQVARLPSGAKLTPKIPDRNLGQLAAVLEAQVREVERQLPETAYSRLRELELSGRAIRYALMDVIDRFNEAFANYSQGMVRLNQMSLTIGQVLGLEGFSVEEIGEYGADGATFEHTYTTPDPFPVSRIDEAEAEAADATALAAYREIGGEPYRRYLLAHGYSEDEANLEVDSAGSGAVNPLAGLLGNTNF